MFKNRCPLNEGNVGNVEFFLKNTHPHNVGNVGNIGDVPEF